MSTITYIELVPVFQALAITSPLSFSFAGESHVVNPAAAALPGFEDHPLPPSPLVRDLQSVFYNRCYARRLGDPTHDGALPVTSLHDAGYVQLLADGNQSVARWDPGWVIYDLGAGGQVFIRKGDCQRAAVPGEFVSANPPGLPAYVGSVVSVVVHREAVGAQPGWYFAYGDTLSDVWDEFTLLRFYFHCTEVDSPELLRHLTAQLNRYHVPFRLKAPTAPALYNRTDAVVLYVAKRYFDVTARLIAALPDGIAARLHKSVPLFTKPIRPGVGFAEEPNTGESFGMHRCRLTAEGVVEAWLAGDQSAEGRMRAVAGRFGVNNMRLDRPYQNPGSQDSFDVRPVGPQRMTTPDPIFLEAADGIGRQLCRDAVWAGDRCNWLGWAMQPVGRTWSPVYRAQTPALYDGTAGIALFLARLYQFTQDQLQKQTLEGALNRSLAELDGAEGRLRTSVQNGPAGIAYVCVEAGRLLGHGGLVERGMEFLRGLLPAEPEEGGLDICTGSAGLIQVLLAVGRRHGCEQLLAAAIAHGRRLVARAEKSEEGLSWATTPGHSRKNLLGYAHGAAGISCALLELWAETGETEFRAAALEGFRYERANYSDSQRNWPDLRTRNGQPDETPQNFMLAWCHGAPGIGLSRLRAYQLGITDEAVAADLQAALQATSDFFSSTWQVNHGNYSLCHGAGGNADTLIEAAAVLSRPELLATAETVGRNGVAQFHDTRTPWQCGVQVGAHSPNLMLGTAGIGYFYLRLYDPTAVPSVLLIAPEVGTAAESPRRLRAELDPAPPAPLEAEGWPWPALPPSGITIDRSDVPRPRPGDGFGTHE